MADVSVIHVCFRIRPGQEDAFRALVYGVIDRMQHEPTFVTTIAHDHPDDRREMSLYEVWNCTREHFLKVEKPKPYRAPYYAALDSMVEERVVTWLDPVRMWGITSLLGAVK